MSEQLRLGCSGGGKLIAQNFTCAAVQSLAAAPKQVLISRILNERMLKAVFGFRRKALHQEYVGLSQPFQRRLQCLVLHFGNGANERVGEAAPDYGIDLCNLTRRSEPVQPRGQGLLQRRWDCLTAALLTAPKWEACNLLDEQRYTTGALGYAFDHLLRQRVAGGKLLYHMPNLITVERHQRNHAVMRARAPGRPELWPGSQENEQWG